MLLSKDASSFPKESAMSDTRQPEPIGTGATGDEAAAALAEIRGRQERVIKAVLVPVWYWWALGAAIVGIGAARDSGDLPVQAITIPLAVLVMAVLTAAMIPAVRRRVEVRIATQARSRAAAAIFSLILLVDAVIVATAASLAAAHARYPGTIGTAAGAAVIVIAGPLVNRYLRGLMLSQVQQIKDAPQAGGSTS
jgi:hypothetical protein